MLGYSEGSAYLRTNYSVIGLNSHRSDERVILLAVGGVAVGLLMAIRDPTGRRQLRQWRKVIVLIRSG